MILPSGTSGPYIQRQEKCHQRRCFTRLRGLIIRLIVLLHLKCEIVEPFGQYLQVCTPTLAGATILQRKAESGDDDK